MTATWKKGLATVASIGMIGVLLAGCGAKGSSPSASNNTSNGSSTSSNATTSNSGSSSNAGKPIEGGSITVDTSQAVPDLDPAVAFDTTSAEVDYAIYQQLVTYKKGSYEIIPQLAKSWNISSDGLTYTFHLKKGIKFSNGDPMNATSFVTEFQRLLQKNLKPKPSPGSQFFMNIKGAQAYYDGSANKISGITTPDKYTLVIKLKKPENFFLKILAMPFASAVDPAYIKKHGNAAMDTTNAMGTGPFKLVTNSQSKVVLKKNPNYWQKDKYGQQLPYLNQVTINVNNNGQVDAMNWEQGKTAFMSPWLIGGDGIPSSQYPTIMNSPQYKKLVMKQPQNSIFYIGLNMQSKINGKKNPLSNLDVRKAMEYAFKDSKMVKLNNGAVKGLNQPLPDTMQGYVKKLSPSATYGYNLSQAKALMKKSPYPKGFTMDYWSENTNTAKNEATAFQSMMSQIGITVNLHVVTWKDFLSKAMTGNAQSYMSGWQQDFPDPSDFLNTLLNSKEIPQNNMNHYNNKQVDQWLNQAQYSTDTSKRNALYAKVINKVMSDAAWIPMTQNVGYYCVQSWVHGFYTSPVMYDPFGKIWISKGH